MRTSEVAELREKAELATKLEDEASACGANGALRDRSSQ
jgi:hypothetical protein